MEQAQIPQDRYHRQMLLPQITPAGQERLAQARVLLVGCGALGTTIADQLVRAGVGFLRIADRDVVELTNLQRQVLFDEDDSKAGLPKAIAAANRLRKINSEIQIDPQVVDVHSGNLEQLAGLDQSAISLILDGTDNIETRYLINDFSIRHGIPWIYGACIGTEGRVMPILPGKTTCLRCVFPQPPAPGELATCDTTGVLGSAAVVVASIQAAMAIKHLVGGQIDPQMIVIDLWTSHFRTFALADAKSADCPCCGQRNFEFLDRSPADRSVSLCGRSAVQIAAPAAGRFDMVRAAERLSAAGKLEKMPYFLRCQLHDPAGISLTVFPDGRLIIHGTDDPAKARSIAARYVGS